MNNGWGSLPKRTGPTPERLRFFGTVLETLSSQLLNALQLLAQATGKDDALRNAKDSVATVLDTVGADVLVWADLLETGQARWVESHEEDLGGLHG